jgi:hypothetical protein
MPLSRRRWLGYAAGTGVVARARAGGASSWLSGPPAPIATIPDSDAPLAGVDALATVPAARVAGAWSLAQMLEHAALSVDFSIDGYPALRPVWFRESLGALAFRVFARRGRMQHDTDELIPGAPALSATDPHLAAQRLTAALHRFEAQPDDFRFAPHFAFGELDKARYRRAHLMHLADHARTIVRG